MVNLEAVFAPSMTFLITGLPALCLQWMQPRSLGYIAGVCAAMFLFGFSIFGVPVGNHIIDPTATTASQLFAAATSTMMNLVQLTAIAVFTTLLCGCRLHVLLAKHIAVGIDRNYFEPFNPHAKTEFAFRRRRTLTPLFFALMAWTLAALTGTPMMAAILVPTGVILGKSYDIRPVHLLVPTVISATLAGHASPFNPSTRTILYNMLGDYHARAGFGLNPLTGTAGIVHYSDRWLVAGVLLGLSLIGSIISAYVSMIYCSVCLSGSKTFREAFRVGDLLEVKDPLRYITAHDLAASNPTVMGRYSIDGYAERLNNTPAPTKPVEEEKDKCKHYALCMDDIDLLSEDDFVVTRGENMTEDYGTLDTRAIQKKPGMFKEVEVTSCPTHEAPLKPAKDGKTMTFREFDPMRYGSVSWIALGYWIVTILGVTAFQFFAFWGSQDMTKEDIDKLIPSPEEVPPGPDTRAFAPLGKMSEYYKNNTHLNVTVVLLTFSLLAILTVNVLMSVKDFSVGSLYRWRRDASELPDMVQSIVDYFNYRGYRIIADNFAVVLGTTVVTYLVSDYIAHRSIAISESFDDIFCSYDPETGICTTRDSWASPLLVAFISAVTGNPAIGLQFGLDNTYNRGLSAALQTDEYSVVAKLVLPIIFAASFVFLVPVTPLTILAAIHDDTRSTFLGWAIFDHAFIIPAIISIGATAAAAWGVGFLLTWTISVPDVATLMGTV